MSQRPTILDVAKQAGVSKSTVSLVLRGSDAVKPDTRDAVRRAMTEIGYVYNRSAATLRSASSGLIGLVINDLRNPFFTEFAALFQMELARSGFATVMANTDEDPELQKSMISTLAEHGVSGLVISPVYGDEQGTLSLLSSFGIPTLQVFRTLDPSGNTLPFSAPDYHLGGRLATQHLLDMGCNRIAFLGGLNGRPVTRERMSGYLDVLDEKGMEPLILTGESTRAFGKITAARMRRDHPDVDAVLCFNDLVALGVVSASTELRVEIGKDLRVIGFDDIEDCGDSSPPLSSVCCDIPDFAKSTAQQILSWVKNGEKPADIRRSVVRLVTRASSDFSNDA